MIDEIRITKVGVEYDLAESAPDDARQKLSEAGDPTNPTVAESVLD